MRALIRSKLIVIGFVATSMVLACTTETAEQDTTNTLVTIRSLGAIDSDVLNSDVCLTDDDQTFATMCVAVNDVGSVTMQANAKNLVPNVGSTYYNNVVFDRYRVTFVRADGRNTPGVDVPYAFDGAMNLFLEIGGAPQSASFTIVRQAAKLEPPLANLAGNGGAIVFTSIAQIDFYGADGSGRAITVSGQLEVTFGDF